MRASRRLGIDPITLWWFGVAAVLLLVLLLTSCASLSPGEQARAVEVLGQMLTSGSITRDQYDALMAALTGDGGWWGPILQTVTAIVGAWLGVPAVAAIARGRTSDRKGLAEAIANISPQQMVGARVTAAADKAAEAVPMAPEAVPVAPVEPVKTPATIPVQPG